MSEQNKERSFGKVYSLVGDTKSNSCLCTMGDVMVKTPNRYVCIFKNGKLNVEDQTQLFTVDSTDKFKKDGVYLVRDVSGESETDSVYLYIDGLKVLLSSDANGYISYTAAQELTAEQFITALQNGGLYFKTLDDAKNKGVTQGLVYILDEGRLYRAVDGEFVEFMAGNDPSLQEEESEVDEENSTSLQIGNIYIDGEDSYIDSTPQLSIRVDNAEYVLLRTGTIAVKADVTISTSETVKTSGAVEGESGFLLYTRDGESYIEVDNLTVRNGYSFEPSLYSTYIGSPDKNLILSASWNEAPKDIELTTKYVNTFSEGDTVVTGMPGGNALTVTWFTTTDDNGDECLMFQALLARTPSQETVVSVTCEIDDGNEYEGDEELPDSAKYVLPDIVIPATPYIEDDEEEDDDEPIYMGYITMPIDFAMVDILSVEIVSGDSDIYWDQDGEAVGTDVIASAVFGTVLSVDPLVVRFPDQTDMTDGVLNELRYAPIWKVAGSDYPPVLEVSGGSVKLARYEAEESEVNKDVIAVIGDLSSVGAEGYGLGSALDAPEDVNDEAYDNIVPNMAWVKASIDAKLSDITSRLDSISSRLDDIESRLDTAGL